MNAKKDNNDVLYAMFMIAFAIIFQAINEFKKEKDINKSNNLSNVVNEKEVK